MEPPELADTWENQGLPWKYFGVLRATWATGACKKPTRAVGVSLVLRQDGSGVCK